MGGNIYKQLLIDSPIVYLCVKVVKEENGDFEGVKIIDVSNTFLDILDMSYEEVIGKTDFEI
ncbi:MAG: hypothetical protein ACRDD7_06915 [Peptostreptococcaceae bacterium]